MRVETLEEGEAILAGGVVLEPGLYAFTDGSGGGGVGVAIVRMNEGKAAEPQVLKKVSTMSARVLANMHLDHEIHSPAKAKQLRNGLAEVAALYVALQQLDPGSEATIIHDYKGVEAFVRKDGPWRRRDSTIRAVVEATQDLLERKQLELHFRHQRSHRSDWAGRHDYVRFNRMADELAKQGEELPE